MKKAVKYYCGCWMCTSSKEKKSIARKKEKRLFRVWWTDLPKIKV